MRTSFVLLLLVSSISWAAVSQESHHQLLLWAQRGQAEKIQEWLTGREPVEIDTPGIGGWTALMHSVKQGHEAVIQLLIEAGANVDVVNDAGETALHVAAKNNQLEAARLLLEAGADFTVRDGENRLPLYRAIEHGHADVIDLLQAAAAQAASIRNRPVHMGAAAEETEPPKIVRSVPAPYTKNALREGVEGTVVLLVLVRRDGSIGGASVSKGLEQSLDQAALEAVRKWEFEPAVREGRPVDLVLQIEIDFALPENR